MTTPMTPTDDQGSAGTHTEELDPVFLLADTDPDAMSAMNQQLIAGFRATAGRLDGAFDGVPLLLLTTTGAAADDGPPRRSTTRPPLAAGSLTGRNPARRGIPIGTTTCSANPRATIELPGVAVNVHARIAKGAERQRLFNRHAAQLPNFAAYQGRTSRQLPVVILEKIT